MKLMKLNELAIFLAGQIKGAGNGTTSLFDHIAPPDFAWSGFAWDSRTVKPGNIYIVVPCDQAYDHAVMAVKAGAVGLIAEADLTSDITLGMADTIPLITVASARHAISKIAAITYPGQPTVNLAVTGTNGKSSVVTFVRQMWEHLGLAAASLGSLGVQLTTSVKLQKKIIAIKLNTPDPFSLHEILHNLAKSEVNHCVFEASSHGLDQYRCHEVNLAAAGFTNLTQDHLDYHTTMDKYFEAKARLFWEVLQPGKVAVLNAASSCFSALQALCSGRGQKVVSFGIDRKADIVARNLRHSTDQIQFDLTVDEQEWANLSVNLVGEFQVENILCALGMVMAGGVSASSAVEAFPHLRSAPGRMEKIGKTREEAPVFIDYSHTPDCLSRALQALRSHVKNKGRLVVVFGCGGNRDAGKRVLMGEAAHNLADVAYITDDNPRHEDPAFIRAQIKVACPQAIEIGDRREAIRIAILDLRADDVLLVAGKGDERVQIIGNRTTAFEDRTEVQKHLPSESTHKEAVT
jgi:UDP-N-acetylmuramoyl-L-alanyl-D-glutamate--2,6-diaminopimelate ligase